MEEDIKATLYELKYIILFYVIGDWASTVYAISYDYGIESNSLPSYIITNFGIIGLFVMKLVFLGILIYLMPLLKSNMSRWIFTKRLIEFVGITVTVNNVTVIFFGNGVLQYIGIL